MSGRGGLLAGSALSAKALSPRCRVIGVEPEAGNDGQQSFRAGHVIRIPVPRSIADGALTTYLGANNFPLIRGLVHDIVTVSDQMLIDAMKFFAERMKIVVEPPVAWPPPRRSRSGLTSPASGSESCSAAATSICRATPSCCADPVRPGPCRRGTARAIVSP